MAVMRQPVSPTVMIPSWMVRSLGNSYRVAGGAYYLPMSMVKYIWAVIG